MEEVLKPNISVMNNIILRNRKNELLADLLRFGPWHKIPHYYVG